MYGNPFDENSWKWHTKNSFHRHGNDLCALAVCKFLVKVARTGITVVPKLRVQQIQRYVTLLIPRTQSSNELKICNDVMSRIFVDTSKNAESFDMDLL